MFIGIITTITTFVLSVFDDEAFQSTLLKSVECRSYHGRFQNSRFKRESSEVIVFNDTEKHEDCAIPELKSNRFSEEATSSCPNNHGYCEHVANYPISEIQNLLKNQPKLLDSLYIEDEIIDPSVDRFGGDKFTQLCPTTTEVVYPQQVRSRTDELKFVVNTNEHRQGVRVERCLNVGKECEIISYNLPLGYKSFCEQKYVTRVMVVAEAKDGKLSGIVTEPFPFPSCCSCSLRMITDRSGFQSPGRTSTRSRNATATALVSKTN